MASSHSKDLLRVELKDDADPSPFLIKNKPDIRRPEPSSVLAQAMNFLDKAELDTAKPVSIEEGFDGNEEGCLELDVGLVPLEEEDEKKK